MQSVTVESNNDYNDTVLQDWMSSCLLRILFTNRGLDPLDYIPVTSTWTYLDVFRAVSAARGGPDDVVRAVINCTQLRSSLSRRRRRRRRRRSWQSAPGCRRRRRAAVRPWSQPRTSPGDGRTPHLEGVHRTDTHLRRHSRSTTNDDESRKYVAFFLPRDAL